MTFPPLISVVMVTYNHEKYIAEAIQSILDQTLSEFELIIVNDGSTDKTEETIKLFSDKRIKYIYQENQGPSAATNTGIMAASSPYLALMSGDDVCYSERLKVQYEFLERSNNCKICFSHVDFIDEESQPINHTWGEEIFNNSKLETRAEILRHFFYHGNFLNGITCAAKKDLFIEAGLYNPCSIQLQDFDLWIKFIKKHPIQILPDKLIKYRFRAANMNLSSSEHLVRIYFEHTKIFESIFNNLPQEIFKEAFADKLKKPDFTSDNEYQLEKAFLYLTHEAISFQCIGISRLFTLLQDSKMQMLAKREHNFALSDLFKLMNKADYGNMVECSAQKKQIEWQRQEIERLTIEIQKRTLKYYIKYLFRYIFRILPISDSWKSKLRAVVLLRNRTHPSP